MTDFFLPAFCYLNAWNRLKWLMSRKKQLIEILSFPVVTLIKYFNKRTWLFQFCLICRVSGRKYSDVVGRMKVGKKSRASIFIFMFLCSPLIHGVAVFAGVCHRGLKTSERDKQTHAGALSYHNLRTEEDYREYGRVWGFRIVVGPFPKWIGVKGIFVQKHLSHCENTFFVHLTWFEGPFTRPKKLERLG